MLVLVREGDAFSIHLCFRLANLESITLSDPWDLASSLPAAVEVGDTFAFYTPELNSLGFEAKLLNLSGATAFGAAPCRYPAGDRVYSQGLPLPSSCGQFLATFDKPLPTLPKGARLTSLRLPSRVTIEGNLFRDHRGRGVLTKVPRTSIISNRFEHQTMSAVLVEAQNNAFGESQRVVDLLIAHNNMTNCSLGGYGSQSGKLPEIWVAPAGSQHSGRHENVTVTGNLIEQTAWRQACSMTAVDGARVTDNTIRWAGRAGHGSSFALTGVSQLSMSDNQCQQRACEEGV